MDSGCVPYIHYPEAAERCGRECPRAFDNLASYESYRTRLKVDAEGRENFAMAQAKRFFLPGERNFVEVVDGTFGIPATLPA